MNYDYLKAKYFEMAFPLYIQGKRLSVFENIRTKEKDLTSFEILSALKKMFNEISEAVKKDVSLVKKHLPDVCCLNCCGICGQWREQTKSIFESDGITIRGSRCPRFKTVADLMKEDFVLQKIKATPVYECSKRIQSENGVIVSISQRKNIKNGNLLKPKTKLYFFDKERFVLKVVEILKEGNGRFAIDFVIKKPFLIKNVPIKKGEKYSDYVDRINEETRIALREIEVKSYAMSFDEACERFKSFLNESEKEVFKTYPSVEAFLRDFYPNMSVWQVVAMIEQEGV